MVSFERRAGRQNSKTNSTFSRSKVGLFALLGAFLGGLIVFGRKSHQKVRTTASRYTPPVVKKAHHHIVVRPHVHLTNRYSWYRRWHEWPHHKLVHNLVLVTYLVLGGALMLQMASPAFAATNWTQSTWSGGSGASTVNQYSSNTNMDTATGGRIQLSSNQTVTNGTFESDLSNWSTDNSQIIPAVVQTVANTTPSNTTLTVTWSTTPVVNNTMLLVYSAIGGSPGTITVPAGWTLDASVINASSANQQTVVYRKLATASESSSVTLTNTSAIIGAARLYEVTGLDTSSPLDIVSTSTTASATTHSLGPTSTTTQDNEFALAAIGLSSTGTTPAFTGGFTIGSSATASAFTGYKILNSKQSLSSTFTHGTARFSEQAIVTYKAARTNQLNTMAPVALQATSTAVTAVTAVSATYATTPSAGNTLFASIATAAAPGPISLPSGWVEEYNIQSGTGSITALYRKVAGASESTTPTFTTANTVTGRIDLYEVRGIAQVSPRDQSQTFTNFVINATTNYIIPTLSPSLALEFALGASGTSGNNNLTNSWTSYSMLNPTGSADAYLRTAYRTLSTTAAFDVTLTSAAQRTIQGFLATFKPDSYVSATRSTSTTHASTSGSTKLVSSTWTDARYTQAVNVGSTQTQTIVAYARTDGSAVTSSDLQLYYDGAAISTTYTDTGSGWYKLSATVAGVNASKDYGFQLSPNKTVYIDDVTVSAYKPTGSLVSNAYNLGYGGDWGTLTYTSAGTGAVSVKVRTSNNSSMTGAPSFSTCTAIASGTDLTGASCVTDNDQYIQYEVSMVSDTGAETPNLTNVSINYIPYDQTPPSSNASAVTVKRSVSGATLASNAWTNGASPAFSWTAGADNGGGSGLQGYCLYLGTDNTANPTTTKGLLGTSPLDTDGACQFAVSGTNLDTAVSGILATPLTTSNSAYYLNVRAIDVAGNVYSSGSAQEHFRFDNEAPINPEYANAPSQFINTKVASITWPNSGGSAPTDGYSGVAGLQYKIGNSTWYGDAHNGAQDATDLLSNDGSYTTQNSPDFANIAEGNNTIYLRTWDAAGNVSSTYITTVLKVNTSGAPTSPRNVDVTPATNTSNSFAFSWVAPATFVGSASNITYCYTVNTVPTSNNCSFTAAGVLSLSAGPYATQPGENTFYIVARDESSNINYATYATATFTANTAAPGVPLNMDAADISVKSSNSWKLAISWEAPTDTGAGISVYRIYRSINNTSFSQVATAASTSYVDTGLTQTTYYYKVTACDSANNCGAASAVVSKLPTGKFTTAANLTSDPVISNITTKRARITWSTDRGSDSKIALGTSTGHYSASEIGNSAQVTSHVIDLDNLAAGTTYYYQVKWTDEDGNTGTCQEYSFSTAPAPVLKEVVTQGVSLDGAIVDFTTKGAVGASILYGKSDAFGGIKTLNTSTAESKYSFDLTGLEDGTKYYYKIILKDSEGGEYASSVFSFSTPARPKISQLQFQPVDGEPTSTQRVTWVTNVGATSQVTYGKVGAKTDDIVDSKIVTDHEVTIRGLADSSEYRLVASGRDSNGNLATSDAQIFKTALDTRPPKITDVVVETTIRGTGSEARGQLVVSWKTDEPATSQVAFSEGSSAQSVQSRTTEDANLTTEHLVIVSDLSAARPYTVQALAADRSRNAAQSDAQTALIGRASDSILSIIFGTLQRMFGFSGK